MDTSTEMLIMVLRERMERMTDAERLALIESLTDGYCVHCGCATGGKRCHCTNDE